VSTMPDATETMTDFFRRSAETFSRGLQASLKTQGETFQAWSDLAARGAEDFRGACETFVCEGFPRQIQAWQQAQQVAAENMQRSVEFFQRSMDLASAPANAEMYDKMRDMFRSSVSAAQESAQWFARSNAEWVDGWTQSVGSFARERGSTARNGQGAKRRAGRGAK
jgi:hypothetical protein